MQKKLKSKKKKKKKKKKDNSRLYLYHKLVLGSLGRWNGGYCRGYPFFTLRIFLGRDVKSCQD